MLLSKKKIYIILYIIGSDDLILIEMRIENLKIIETIRLS